MKCHSTLLGDTVQFLIVEGILWNIVLNFIGSQGVNSQTYS